MGLGLGWVGGRIGIEMGVGGEVRVGGGLGLGLRLGEVGLGWD